MSNTKKTKKKIKDVSERYTLTNTFVNLFLLVIFAVFPLFVNLTFDTGFPFIHFDRGYFAIRHQKFYFLMVASAAAVIAEVLLVLTRSTQEQKDKNPKTKSLLADLSFTDYAALAFALACAVSTVLSDYIDMAFFGEVTIAGASHGRNNGLLLMLMYVAVYFMITRCWKYKEYVFVGLAVTSGIVSLLAVLNTYYIDPLNMFALFTNDEKVFNEFLTTIGNKNMFASHLCVTLPVAVTMFVHSENKLFKVIYLCAAVLGGMAFVACDSDSAVLGLGVFAAVFTVAYARRPHSLKKFLLMLTVMLGSVKLLGLITAAGAPHKKLEAIPYKIMTADAAYWVLAFLAVLTAVLYLLDHKMPGKLLPRAVPVVLGSLVGLAALGGLGTVIYFTAIDTKTDLGELDRTLRFSDSWGTHRGFMWNKALEEFGKLSFVKKLFGTGPETFYYTFSPHFAELYDRFGDGSPSRRQSANRSRSCSPRRSSPIWRRRSSTSRCPSPRRCSSSLWRCARQVQGPYATKRRLPHDPPCRGQGHSAGAVPARTGQPRPSRHPSRPISSDYQIHRRGAAPHFYGRRGAGLCV